MSAFPLFHWSPLDRRETIEAEGLRPHSLSRDGEWYPPYICFSSSPSHAWSLSAQFQERYEWWALWMMWSNRPSNYEKTEPNPDGLCEYRVYECIMIDDIWFAGLRSIWD